jgi:hypothetical protein
LPPKEAAAKIGTCILEYVAQTSEELTIKAGEKLLVHESDDPENGGWWHASLLDGSKSGFVPAEFVELEPESSQK